MAAPLGKMWDSCAPRAWSGWGAAEPCTGRECGGPWWGGSPVQESGSQAGTWPELMFYLGLKGGVSNKWQWDHFWCSLDVCCCSRSVAGASLLVLVLVLCCRGSAGLQGPRAAAAAPLGAAGEALLQTAATPGCNRPSTG